ncbi:MAG: ribosome small subunit-dependent GTPase A [Bacteroidota bacterium]
MGKKKRDRPTSPDRPLIEGIVIRSVGSQTRVQTADESQYECVVRGKFRIKGLNTTNPVAVGDWVRFHLPEQGELGVIRELLPRKNYILRKAISHGKKVHILASNVDQAVLLFTIDQPATSTGFANRFLVTTEAYHIPTYIVINKLDLLSEPEQLARLKEVEELYAKIGYPIIKVSALEASYAPQIASLLRDKLTFIGGHSGAGKSTLINLIDPELDLKTSEISQYSNKGRHTTTFAQMHKLKIGGYIIDSPGIKELGLTDLERGELSHYFPEMRERMEACRFHNCTHINEPHCAVQAALEKGEVHPSRYDSYLRMLEDIDASSQW